MIPFARDSVLVLAPRFPVRAFATRFFPTVLSTAASSGKKKRWKVQLPEEGVAGRLHSAVNEDLADTRVPLDERLFENSDLMETCKNFRQLDSLKDTGLTMQAFAIGPKTLEVVQARSGSLSDTMVVQQLKKLHLAGFGNTKVAEGKRFYRHCTLYPRLLKVSSGITARQPASYSVSVKTPSTFGSR